MLARYMIFVKNDFRESHISFLYLGSYFLTTFLTLTVYWYTSKAFAGAISAQIQQFNGRYFDFIVIGEIAFLLPTVFYTGPLQIIKRWVSNNTFESLIMTGRSELSELWTQVSAGIPSQACFASLYLFIAHFAFDWSVSLSSLGLMILLNLLSLPLFFTLGLVMTSVFLLTGKGSSLMGQLVTFLAIFSGAYFPIHVLPSWLTQMSSHSPFQIFMESSRLILANQWDQVQWGTLTSVLGLWTLVTSMIAIGLFKLSLSQIRKRGSYFPKTRSIL